MNGGSIMHKIIKDEELLFSVQSRTAQSNIAKSVPVPPNLHYHSFDYTQLYRGVRSCLYQQTLHGKTVGYEVSLICIQPEININGEIYLERERWPKDADFGKTAWSYWTHEEAMMKYNQLESKTYLIHVEDEEKKDVISISEDKIYPKVLNGY